MAMKLLVGTAILCMLATAPVYARQSQDDKQQEAPKAPDRGDKTANKPANKPAEKPVDKPSKPAKEAPVKAESAPRHQQDQQAQQQQKTQEKAQQNQEKAQQNQKKEQQEQAKNQQKQAERQAKNQKQDRNQQTADNGARGNEGGRRIPEDRYRADFGRAHTFHVRHDNDDRFQFGGFWFQYTDAWPSDWAYGDDFYIVEIDGVDYLCDARLPDQRIVVVIAS